MLACFAGQFDAVKLLRSHGARYDDYDRGGSTPIHWAVDGGNVRLIEWIVKDGADVNLRDHSHGWTPLIRCGGCLSINNISLPGRCGGCPSIKILVRYLEFFIWWLQLSLN